ncbi:hypothetical protein Ssi03_74550 [Sphaerisporangium siamense]|uniref:3-hydroxyacyl-CoA dehydrogenase n=1 Tax=Sphaerisporangium siamense TaxID=795645 RepID=A0A7W7GAD6_9ACTN|nr:hypothetical protein [Sphaerisporangium siamense]MBB4702307.1 3-hydroxyacyl-CoA dehydrogenase [Sphaerisporangium siamense]GII89465.1 hypothetical protein Ssi03_74550 [Sphaerisporangium siamense]
MTLFKTRADAIERSSDATARNLRKAAAAKKRGDTEAMRHYAKVAKDLDQVTTRLADGDIDQLIENP